VIRAVLDTNTIVSGVGWGGTPGAVLDAALDGQDEIITSPALLDELRRVLSYAKLQAVVGDADELIKLLALAAIVVTPTETVTISRDPDDDGLIEGALAANADVIVTGDQDLLTLGRIGQIQVLTPESSSSHSSRAPDSRHPGAKQLCAEATLTAPAHHHGDGCPDPVGRSSGVIALNVRTRPTRSAPQA
jgi:uncharacterized protein